MNSREPQQMSLGIPRSVQEDLLSSRRRCQLLIALDVAGGEAAVTTLAAEIYAAGSEPSSTTIDPAELDSLRSEIYEYHLPKLTVTGIVEYDSLLGKVRLQRPGIIENARDRLES